MDSTNSWFSILMHVKVMNLEGVNLKVPVAWLVSSCLHRRKNVLQKWGELMLGHSRTPDSYMRCLKLCPDPRHTALLWGLTGWAQRGVDGVLPCRNGDRWPTGSEQGGPNASLPAQWRKWSIGHPRSGRLAAGECHARILWFLNVSQAGTWSTSPRRISQNPAVPRHPDNGQCSVHDRDPEDGAPLEAHKNGHANEVFPALAPAAPALTAASSRSKPNGCLNGYREGNDQDPHAGNRSAPSTPWSGGKTLPGLPLCALLLCPHHSMICQPMNEYLPRRCSLHCRTRSLTILTGCSGPFLFAKLTAWSL